MSNPFFYCKMSTASLSIWKKKIGQILQASSRVIEIIWHVSQIFLKALFCYCTVIKLLIFDQLMWEDIKISFNKHLIENILTCCILIMFIVHVSVCILVCWQMEWERRKYEKKKEHHLRSIPRWQRCLD